MQDARVLKNPRNLKSWRAWKQEGYQQSGSHTGLGVIVALMFAFVISITVFGDTLGGDLVLIALIGLILYLVTSSALMAAAVLRLNAWKRAHPWTPPS